MIVQLHGEVDIIREDLQVLHEQEELPDEQNGGTFGVLHSHTHLHILPREQKHTITTEAPSDPLAYRQHLSKPLYVHLWPLLGVLEFELV